ncbi:MAG: hypothetical protein NTY65_06450 [Planctomycetota bacterium]|nr:hypothetical protein [Planctomycetota bacterium]
MTVDDFAKVTQKVIAKDGFDRFLPIACFSRRNHLAVLEGVPANADIQSVTVKWAISKALPGEEILIAFKVDSSHFKIMRLLGDHFEERMFPVTIV